MDASSLLTFKSPPLPYFIDSNQTTYQIGDEHPNRTNLGLFDLLYVRQGKLYIAEEQKRWCLAPGEALILRPDCWHYSFKPCDEETVFDWLHFQTAGPWEEVESYDQIQLHGDYYNYALRVPKYVKFTATNEIESILSSLHTAAQGGSHAAFWERQERFAHLLQLFDDGWRKETAKAAVVVAEKAAAYLKRNYKNHLTNQDLSKYMGLHINYITRSMTEIFDCTPQQYLMFYRIDQAKLLLIKTDWPIAKIAEETGFKQTPHFSRLFTAQVGLSPLRYRKKFTN